MVGQHMPHRWTCSDGAACDVDPHTHGTQSEQHSFGSGGGITLQDLTAWHDNGALVHHPRLFVGPREHLVRAVCWIRARGYWRRRRRRGKARAGASAGNVDLQKMGASMYQAPCQQHEISRIPPRDTQRERGREGERERGRERGGRGEGGPLLACSGSSTWMFLSTLMNFKATFPPDGGIVMLRSLAATATGGL